MNPQLPPFALACVMLACSSCASQGAQGREPRTRAESCVPIDDVAKVAVVHGPNMAVLQLTSTDYERLPDLWELGKAIQRHVAASNQAAFASPEGTAQARGGHTETPSIHVDLRCDGIEVLFHWDDAGQASGMRSTIEAQADVLRASPCFAEWVGPLPFVPSGYDGTTAPTQTLPAAADHVAKTPRGSFQSGTPARM